jgi:hypothetical protein
MAIPRQCHKHIRGDEKQYCVETIHTLKKYTFCFALQRYYIFLKCANLGYRW